ncbi:MAG: hypothetical protein ABIB71_07005 [Candidatus Woesearchaeota archaeon]
MTKESLILQANKILGKNKRLFNTSYDKELKFSLNKENYDYENKIAGKFLLVTNTNYKADNVMKAYKELQNVENAFDELKNFLDIRPIYHRTENRVKAHVFICVLSFLIECIIEKFLEESARKTLRKLERIKIISFNLKDNKKNILTKLPRETETIFKQLKINKPLMPISIC